MFAFKLLRIKSPFDGNLSGRFLSFVAADFNKLALYFKFKSFDHISIEHKSTFQKANSNNLDLMFILSLLF